MTLVNKVFYNLFLCLFIFSVHINAYSSSDLKEQLTSHIYNDIQDHYPYVSSSNIHINFINYSDFLNEDFFDLDITSFRFKYTADRSLLGRTIMPIELLNQKKEVVRFVRLPVEVKAYAHFVKTSRVIKKGSIISPQDVTLQLTDIYAKPQYIFTKLDDVIGLEAKSTLPIHIFLTHNAIQPSPLFRKGDLVTILIQKPFLSISTKGIAMEDGVKGSFVRVKSKLKKSPTLKGEVVNENTVKVQFIN